jgi:hypothetical protein
VLGINFQAVEDDSSRLHYIIANSVTGHPRNFIFRHKVLALFGMLAASERTGLRFCAGRGEAPLHRIVPDLNAHSST